MNNHNKSIKDTASLAAQEEYIGKVRELVAAKASLLGRPLLAYVATFGCQQNEADSEKLLGTAISLGYSKAESIENADLIIYNTCAVREHAELRAFSKAGQLKHLKEKNKDLIIGLWGCMVSQMHRMQDVKMKYPYIDFVAGTNMLHRLPEILCDVMVSSRRRYYVDDEAHVIVEDIPTERASDIKSWISIMYGCNNFCTYCVVPYVRGRERSREQTKILDEIRSLTQKGYRELTLLGQNVNSYKSDGCDFPTLLRKAASFNGDYWVRFMTSHPKDATDELIDVIADCDRVAKHFHLPVQSGSNEILSRMNRKYTREKYLELAEKIKQKIPGISLTTDIIVGFPGETEKDFLDTLEIVEKVRFDSIYAFIYSPRVGTPAAEMEDNMTHEQKTERMARLLELQTRISAEINAEYMGKDIKVLCDSKQPNEKGYFTGRTSGNKMILFTCDIPDIYGKFVEVTVNKVTAAQIFGKVKR